VKGNISPTLRRILADDSARADLRNQLIRGEDGRISVGGNAFRLRLRLDVATARKKADRRS